MEKATDSEPLPPLAKDAEPLPLVGMPRNRESFGALSADSTVSFTQMSSYLSTQVNRSVANRTSFIPGGRDKTSISLARNSDRSPGLKRANTILAAHVAPPRAAFAKAFGSHSMADWSNQRYRSLRLVSSEAFDIAVGIVIVLNGIVIGLELDLKSSENEVLFSYLEVLFLCLFTLELGMKMYVFRLKFFMLLIHWLDTSIVVLGFMAWALRLIISMESAARQIQLFKLARLMRLVRLIRISTQFRPLWLLVQGLCNSIAPVSSTVALVAANLYIFGVIAVEFISSDEELQAVPWGRLGHTAGQKFANLPVALLSLFDLFAINEVGGEAFDLAQLQPMAMVFVLAFVFIVVVGLLNLFTGVLAENGNNVARHDEEHIRAVALADWQNICDELEALFAQMTAELERSGDPGNSANQGKSADSESDIWFNEILHQCTVAPEEKLTMDQLLTLCGHKTVCERMNLLFAEPEGGHGGLKRLYEFWPLLDKNGDGVLSLQEFIEGLASLSQVIRNDLNKSYLWLNLFKEMRRSRVGSHPEVGSARLSHMVGAMTVEQVRAELRVQELELQDQRRVHARLRNLARRAEVMVCAQVRTEDQLQAVERTLKTKAPLTRRWRWGMRRPASAAVASNRKSQASLRSKSR